jgi:hypothetical protein
MDAMRAGNSLPRSGSFRAQVLCRYALAGLIFAFLAEVAAGQNISRITEVPVKLLSAEIRKFETPVRVGPAARAVEYREALVLKVAVDRDTFDSLPPDMEPYLYIGRSEYRLFHIDRTGQGKDLVLTFHIQKWEALEDGAPVVLTIDQGAPIRDPERFLRKQVQRFSKKMVVDKR